MALDSMDLDVVAPSNEAPPTAQFDCVAEKSVEGWVIICTNVHEEATEEDISDFFADSGTIESIHLNPDRRTGYAKGYALVEFKDSTEAERAVQLTNGISLMGQTVETDFAFVKPPEFILSRPPPPLQQNDRDRSP